MKNILRSVKLFLMLLLTNLLGKAQDKPNVIVIYVDDMGFGDVGCYGAEGVETPNLDAMAEKGMRFRDAHCPASTSTPSRYSLLTGKYAFRNNAAVLPGDAPLIITPGSQTMPAVFQEAGYTTGVVGKWHLGLGEGNINWNDSIKPGPHEIGFDYSFLIPATGDRVPTVYVEDYQIVGLDPNDPIETSYSVQIGDRPTGVEHPELLKQQADLQHAKTIVNGVSRIGYMKGGKAAEWKDEEFPFVLTKKAKAFINENKEKPFFLYFSYHDIHVPRIPHEKFQGASTMGPRGDAIAQVDWCSGEIINYLEELGLAENTLIIFSSDNGPVLNDGYEDQCIELLGNHKPTGPYRGGKYSSFEGGTRVPMITYWPGTIEPGESDALLTHVDLMASMAAMLDVSVTETVDSKNYLDAWLGKSEKGRDIMLEESFVIALRKGNWKFIPGSNRENGWIEDTKNIESGISPEDKLYDLSSDQGETINQAEKYPKKVKKMKKILKGILGEEFVEEGSEAKAG